MEDFYSTELPPEYKNPQAYVDKFGVSWEVAVQMVEIQCQEQVFLNDTYQVNLGGPHRTKGDAWPLMWHLSIKRRDKEVIHDWRAMQEIKNMIIGEENEAIEIYPAESRLVDCANQYHLWCFCDPSIRIPIGYKQRMVGDTAAAIAVGAKQRERKTVGELARELEPKLKKLQQDVQSL